MSAYQNHKLLGAPVLHAVFLAVWCILQSSPQPSWRAFVAWLIWPMIIAVLISPRVAALITLGAAPFLALAIYYRV